MSAIAGSFKVLNTRTTPNAVKVKLSSIFKTYICTMSKMLFEGLGSDPKSQAYTIAMMK